MNLQNFTLLKEDDNSYTVGHPKGRSIQVSKKGLSSKAQDLISKLKKTQSMSEGGKPQESNEIDQDKLAAAAAAEQQAWHSAPEADPAENIPFGVQGAQESPDEAPPSSGETVSVTLPQDAAAQPAQTPGIPASAEQASQPQQAAGAPVSPMAGLSAGLPEEKAALQAGAAAEGKEGQQNVQALKDYQNQTVNIPTPQQTYSSHQARDQELQNAVASGKVDPNRLWKNLDTGSKVTAGIAMILGGIGSGLTHQPNAAVQLLQSAIERDIDAQKNDQSKTMNLWRMNRENTENEIHANLATENQMMGVVKAKMMSAAAGAQGALGAARIAPVIAQIDQEMAMNNWRRTVMDQQSAGGLAQVDPAQLVPMMVKNPEQQKQVYEEIGRAQNISKNSDKILNAFDQSAKENTVLRTGAGLVRTPGAVMALHQLMLPNFKQVDGTVRQASMDESFHNLTPAPGDTDAKIAMKRQAMVNWMHSETAAPTAKGNGIDLTRFSSTAPPKAAPQFQKMGGHTYQKVPGGWQKVSANGR